MTVPQVAVLSNPASTRNRRVFRRLQRILDGSENIFHFELDSAGGIDGITEALAAFNRTGPAMLIINGGDGTIQATLSSILNDKPFDAVPPIAILPGGKTNMIAEDLGAKGSPERVLKLLLKIARDGTLGERILRRNIIELNLGDGSPLLYGMFFGGAAIVNGIRYCNENIYPMGLPNILSHPMAIGALVTSALGGAKSPDSPMHSEEMKIVMPGGGTLQGRYLVVVATTLDRLLLGLRPYGRDGKGTLKFSAIEHRPRAIFAAAKGIMTGKFGRVTLEGVNTRRIDEIRISGNDPVTLDGEIYDISPGQTVVLKGDKSLDFVSLRKKIA